jgi:hypothetical protein
MRRVFLFGIGLLCSSGVLAAEATRSLTLSWNADPKQPFAVENLAGEMHVLAGSGSAVVVTATVHGESDELAGLMRLEEVLGPKGVPTLRLRYPVNRYSTYRYPQRSSESSWFAKLLGWFSSDTDYDGARVHVARDSGVLLYADVEVRLPPGMDGRFHNVVGLLSGQGVEGHLSFDVSQGRITLDRARGDLSASTGSGDVTAESLSGSFRCDTGSGDCDVTSFEGDSLTIDTGSGAAKVDGAKARVVRADTGSGRVRLAAVDAEEIVGDTGSGELEVEARGHRLRKVKADTGSGSVILHLDREAGFHLRASVNGSIRCQFADARPLISGKEIVGYDRGDGSVAIAVDTGSGNLVVGPADER